MAVRPETPWQAGRLRSPSGLQRLLFGRMYEDAEIEQQAFEGRDRVFCIASAGSTALHLSDQHEVVACDINPAQLAYAERRVRGGTVETSDVERVLNFARALVPLVGWRRGVIRDFVALTDLSEQAAFWRRHLDTRRFRTVFDALMSPAILRAVYSPRFLSFLPDNFGAVLRKRLEGGFTRHPNAWNPYARLLLLGEGDDESWPKAPHIRFVLGDAASFLESCPRRSFDAFALSNILDGVEPSYRVRLSRAVRHAGCSGAVVVLRSFAEPQSDLVANHAERDRALLWGVVDIRAAEAFD